MGNRSDSRRDGRGSDTVSSAREVSAAFFHRVDFFRSLFSAGLHKFLERATKPSSDSQASPDGRHATGNFQIADDSGVAPSTITSAFAGTNPLGAIRTVGIL